MGIWNWHREDNSISTRKHILKVYSDRDSMEKALRIDSETFLFLDEARYTSWTKNLIDVNNVTISYTYLDRVELDARGNQFDMVIITEEVSGIEALNALRECSKMLVY